MDQQDADVRQLQAHPFGVPELRHDGRGQAVARGVGAARTIPRQGPRRGVRRAIRATGLRRLGPESLHVAPRERAVAGGGLRRQGRQARDAGGRADQRRVPNRRAVVPAAPHAVRQESPNSRHRGEPAHRRPRAVPQAPRRFRLRPDGAAVRFLEHPRRLVAQLLLLAGRRDARLAEPRRHIRSGHRCAHRQDHRRRQPREPYDGLSRARPGDPLRPLLGSALVQGLPLARLLGRVWPARGKTPLRARRARDLVVRSRKAGKDRSVNMPNMSNPTENLGLKPVEAARGKATLGDTMTNSKTWVDWPPRQPITIADLIAEAREVEWDFTSWCYASGYDASEALCQSAIRGRGTGLTPTPAEIRGPNR